jgi:hypothetical protein
MSFSVNNAETHVFISYSSVAKDAAQLLCGRIERAGFPCWYAPRDVRPGEHYASELSHALTKSAALVLVLGSNANTSSHVLREVTTAVDKSKPIFVVQFGNFPLSEGLDYLLIGIQRVYCPNEDLETSVANSSKVLLSQLSTKIPWVKRGQLNGDGSLHNGPVVEMPPNEWDFPGRLPLSKWLRNIFKDKQ